MVTAVACKKDKPKPPTNTSSSVDSTSAFEQGVFVVNEGQFTSGSGTITHYNQQSKAKFDDIFQLRNGRPLGSVAQSISFDNDYGFICVNNASKVEIVDQRNFESVNTISNLISPRYYVSDGSKGYVSDWGIEGVFVIDHGNFSVTDTILTGFGPEQMLIHEGYLYVTNGGDWTNPGNTVTVIKIANDSIEDQITVGDKPNSIVADKNGMIWVLCGGIDDWMDPNNNTPGALVQIDPATRTPVGGHLFLDPLKHPNRLAISGEGFVLYYLSDLYDGALYGMPINATSLPVAPLVDRKFYGLGVDPADGNIYASDARFFQQNGIVIRYSPTGVQVDSFEVGLNPGNIVVR